MSNSQTCEWCGQFHPLKICPHVKAINYHRPIDGRSPEISRVEFRDNSLQSIPMLGTIGEASQMPTAAMMGAGVGTFIREISALSTADFGPLKDNADLVVYAIYVAMVEANSDEPL